MLSRDLIRLLDRLLRLDCEFVPTNCHKFSVSYSLTSLLSLYCLCVFRFLHYAQDFADDSRSAQNKREMDTHLPFRCCSPGSVNRCLLSLECFFVAAYPDLLWLGFCPFGHSDLQDALFIAGLHLLSVRSVGELEGAGKGTVPALNAMEVLFLLFFFKLALALDREGVVFQAHVQVFLVHAGNLQHENQIVLVLINVHCGNKGPSRQLRLTAAVSKVLK